MSKHLTWDNEGKVSVIIPYYNQSEFIEDTIQSLINQSYSNWEAIIVNDGSEEPLPLFTDERIFVVNQENSGLPSARNRGIAEARGEYIQFLDSDDMLASDKFESQIAGINIHNASISVSGYLAFKHPNVNVGTSTDTEFIGESPLHDLINRWEMGLCIPIHCFLYKRNVIDRVGGFSTDLPNHEDWDFHIRVAYMNYIYCHDSSKMALYRVHDKSMCRTMDMEAGRNMVIKKHLGWMDVDPFHRVDLTRTTFIYTIRIDSEERLRNLDFAMNFMWIHFYTNIIVIEDDSESRIKGRYRNVTHIFKQNDSPIMHRTKLINDAVKECGTTTFCNIDVDVFMDADRYVEAMECIGDYDIVYPYDGRFYDIQQEYNKNFLLEEKDIDIRFAGLINKDSYGGMVFFKTHIFIEGGMENEKFVSWGAEDIERPVRFGKLGYSIHRMGGPIYHFTHHRGVNSNETNPHYKDGLTEYGKISVMWKEKLEKYVQTFPWLK